MNKILSLISLINKNTLFDIFSKVGCLKKQIGNQYFLNPVDDAYKAISILIINNKVKKIGVQLSDEIELIEVENELGKKAEVSHSIYDGITYYFFTLIDEYNISLINRNNSKEQLSFKELEVVFN